MKEALETYRYDQNRFQMKEWLDNIKAPKFLRYLFFIAYSWYHKFTNERAYAEDSAIIFVSLGHLSILLLLFLNLNHILGDLDLWFGFAVAGLTTYYLFWHKKKWRKYVKEFKDVKRKQQSIGLIYLFAYLFVFILLLRRMRLGNL